MNPSSTQTGPTGYSTHRRLDEPVMPSAAEEVLVNDVVSAPASSATSAEWPFGEGPSAYRTGGTWTAGEGVEGSVAWLSRRKDELEHYVADQPMKATLMAVGVGVLAALAWGRRGSSRQRRG